MCKILHQYRVLGMYFESYLFELNMPIVGEPGEDRGENRDNRKQFHTNHMCLLTDNTHGFSQKGWGKNQPSNCISYTSKNHISQFKRTRLVFDQKGAVWVLLAFFLKTKPKVEKVAKYFHFTLSFLHCHTMI